MTVTVKPLVLQSPDDPYRILTDEELATIMPPRRPTIQPRRGDGAILIASVVMVFVAGWVAGLLTVLFTYSA